MDTAQDSHKLGSADSVCSTKRQSMLHKWLLQCMVLHMVKRLAYDVTMTISSIMSMSCQPLCSGMPHTHTLQQQPSNRVHTMCYKTLLSWQQGLGGL